MSRKRPGGMIPPKAQSPEANIAKVLIERAFSGQTEQCPLCGQEVLSVAVHFVRCPKLEAARSKPKARRGGKNAI